MAVVYATRSDLDDFGGLPDGALSNEGRVVQSSNASADTLVLEAHGLETGEELQVRALEGGTLPSPLVEGTYYAIRVSDSTLKLAASELDATNGAAVDITTSGANFIVAKPLPIDRHLELYSRWVDDFLPAHMVPLSVDGEGNYPLQVVRAVALLSGLALLNRGGKNSEILRENEKEQKAILERWAKAIPLRNVPGTQSSNLAITTRIGQTSSDGTETLDHRGWGSGRLP